MDNSLLSSRANLDRVGIQEGTFVCCLHVCVCYSHCKFAERQVGHVLTRVGLARRAWWFRISDRNPPCMALRACVLTRCATHVRYNCSVALVVIATGANIGYPVCVESFPRLFRFDLAQGREALNALRAVVNYFSTARAQRNSK